MSEHTPLTIHVLALLSKLLLASGILAIAVVLHLYQPLVAQFLDLKARQDCAQSYRLEYLDTKTSTTVSKPIDDLYLSCLSEKNVE